MCHAEYAAQMPLRPTAFKTHCFINAAGSEPCRVFLCHIFLTVIDGSAKSLDVMPFLCYHDIVMKKNNVLKIKIMKEELS